MANNLLTPILNDIRSVNFFNGRLLTGEDLTAEQKANRVARGLLGQAIGAGVAYGFEVSESKPSSSVQAPVLAVTRGLAINRNGTALLLQNDTEITLVRPAKGVNGAAKIFEDCTPVQPGVYVADPGIYLFTVGPATASQGLAEVSGVNTGSVPCNSNYNGQGVQFRLVNIDPTQLNLTPSDLTDKRLRNLVAYQCFGVTDWASVVTDPFGTPPTTFGLIDQLRAAQIITDCEVPLGVLYWTATDGLVFVDMWAVRRKLTQGDVSRDWSSFVNNRAISEGQAVFLQFQAHIQGIRASTSFPQSLSATTYFRYLPAAGILPVPGGAFSGFDQLQFFSPLKNRTPVFIEGSRLRMVLRDSFKYPPIDLASGELIWLYRVRENRQPPQGNSSQPYLLFVTGSAPNYGDAHYNVAHWNYSNYF